MIRTEHIDILPTFGCLTAQPCEREFGFPKPDQFGRDVMLAQHGAASSKVYWIESGVVKMVCLQADGTELITGLRTNGWIVGAQGALVPARKEPVAITATKCELRSLPVETFVKTYQELQTLSRHVTNMLALELALRLRANSSVRHSTTRTRLEHFIDECNAVSRTLPEGVPALRLKQTEIAQIVGSTPEHLSRLLHQMESEQLIDKTKPPFM